MLKYYHIHRNIEGGYQIFIVTVHFENGRPSFRSRNSVSRFLKIPEIKFCHLSRCHDFESWIVGADLSKQTCSSCSLSLWAPQYKYGCCNEAITSRHVHVSYTNFNHFSTRILKELFV